MELVLIAAAMLHIFAVVRREERRTWIHAHPADAPWYLR